MKRIIELSVLIRFSDCASIMYVAVAMIISISLLIVPVVGTPGRCLEAADCSVIVGGADMTYPCYAFNCVLDRGAQLRV